LCSIGADQQSGFQKNPNGALLEFRPLAVQFGDFFQLKEGDGIPVFVLDPHAWSAQLLATSSGRPRACASALNRKLPSGREVWR
jgi:hypothetical protein